MPPITLNIVIIHGSFKIVEKQKELVWNQTSLPFLGNTLTISSKTYHFAISSNLNFLLWEQRRNLVKLLREKIENILQRKIKTFKARAINLQHSTSFYFGPEYLLKSFLPELNRKFPIDWIKITQEANLPVKTNLETILNSNEKIQFQSVHIKLRKESKAHLKLQISKNKTNTHATIILANLHPDSKKFIEYLKTWHTPR